MKKLTFVILCLEGALLSFSVAASAAIVPSVAATFVIPQFLAGRIVWLYMLPYGLAALLYGPLVRAFDARKVELICVFLFTLSSLFAGVAASINQLFWARFLMGVFGASVIPLALILIGTHIQHELRGRFVGVFFGVMFFSSLLGLFLSGIVFWRNIYLYPVGFGVLLLILMYFRLPSFKQDTGKFSVNYLAAFKNAQVLRIFIYIFLISLLYHGIQQWLAVYFSLNLSFSQFVISMLIMFTSLSGVFGEVAGGWFSDIIGRIKTVNFGITLMILSVFLLLINFPVYVFVILMFIWGFGWTLNHAGVSTILTDLPKEFLHESASLNSGIRFIAGGAGVALGGILMQRGLNLNFLIFGLGLILLLVFARKFLLN